MIARPTWRRWLIGGAVAAAIVTALVPIALSVRELAALGSSVQEINAAVAVARDARSVGEKIGMAVTDFTAMALDLDAEERAQILVETDAHVAGIAQGVFYLKLSMAHWLSAQHDQELSDAVDAILHSWAEIKNLNALEFSGAEKAFHFLQIVSNVKTANNILLYIDGSLSNISESRANSVFSKLRHAGYFLVTAMLIGFLLNSLGALGIFGALRATRRSNAALGFAEAALQKRSAQLSEAHRLGRLGDWTYNSALHSFWWAPQIYELLRLDPASFAPTRDDVMSRVVGSGGQRLRDAQAEVLRTGAVRAIDVKIRRGDGSIGDFALTLSAAPDAQSGERDLSGTIQDISERKMTEEKLETLAYRDTLTGLANRAMFLRDFDDVVVWCKRTGANGALLLLDLDRFKDVNDTLGHAAGDELLLKVARIIDSLPGERHTVARLGGDEFAIVLTQCAGQAQIAAVAGALIAGISRSMALEGGEIPVSVSIGIARFPLDGSNHGDLLRHADLALYRAKEEGRGRYVFFAPDMNVAVQYQAALARDLRGAVSGNIGLAAHYQPQIDLATQRVIGYEALLRWDHPTRGRIPPSEFIPIAENSRLICDLGLWILREAAGQAKAWLDAGGPAREVAVNISAAQIRRTDLVAEVAGVLAQTGLPPHLLCLELTESVFANQADGRVATVLSSLKALGVTLALDDFGTDYSSLGYLKQLPFDKLKIDRVFVDGIAESDRSRELLKGIIALGQGLGMTVVAEGAEKLAEVAILRRFGCNLAQGFVFARAMPAPEALAFALEWDARESPPVALVPGNPAIPAIRVSATRLQFAAD